MPSSEVTVALKAFEHTWINPHEPSQYISADLEFINKFETEVNYFGIVFKPTSARRHDKFGVLKRNNSVIGLLVQRILQDASHAEKIHIDTVSETEILSRATFLSNPPEEWKALSSSELARG